MTPYPKLSRRLCILLALPFAAPSSSANEGWDLLGLGPIQYSLAGAGAASAKDTTWLALNPAAIVELDSSADLYVELLSPRRAIDPEGARLLPVVNRWSPEMVDSSAVPIAGAGILRRHGPWAFGAGAFGAGGSTADYARPRTTLGLLQNSDRRGDYWIVRLPIAAAREFDNGWAVGAALLANWTRLRTDSVTLRLRPTQGDYEWEAAMATGFLVGVHKRWDNWSFGAAYATKQYAQEFDRYDDLLRWNLDLPARYQAGLAWRPIERLEILADYKHVDWDGVRILGERNIKGGLGWKDQDIGKLALEYGATPKWTWRAGLAYGRSPVRSETAFMNAQFPGITEWHAGAGFTYTVNNAWEAHFAYARAFPESLEDNGRGDLFSKIGRGTKMSIESHSYILGFTYKF